MGTLHLTVNVCFPNLEAMPGDCLPARLVFYFLTLAPRDYVNYYQARGLAVGYGLWYPQDKTWAAPSEVAQPIRSRRARRALQAIVYSTKYDTFFVTLPLQSI